MRDPDDDMVLECASAGKRRSRGLDLWLVACKSAQPEEVLRNLAGAVLPA